MGRRPESLPRPVEVGLIVQALLVFVKSVWYKSHQHEPVGYRVVVLYTLLGLLVGALLNHAADHLDSAPSALMHRHKTLLSFRVYPSRF